MTIILWYIPAHTLSMGCQVFRHPDHLGQRFGSHLRHDLSPMPFSGDFTGVQICGDPFVEQPTDCQPHDFSRARRQ
jgi:hypothetical protein